MNTITLILIALLLSGCGLLPTRELSKEKPDESERIRQIEQLHKQKRYSDAENLLIETKKHYPYSYKLKQMLEQLIIERRMERQLIEDQLLVTRFTMNQQQQPLLTQLVKSESDDLMIASHLQQLKHEWRESRPQLSACGERQLKSAPETAEKCLRLALAIEEQTNDRKRLTRIENDRAEVELKAQQAQAEVEHQAQQAQAEVEHQAQQERAEIELQAQQKRKAARISRLLEQARSKHQSGEHYDAILLLQKALKSDPESSQVLKLKKEITAELAGYTQSLLSAGETLYQKGEHEGAIAVWKTLLILDPKHQQALEKIERTQRVLDNLQQLREQQQPAGKK